MLSGTVTSAQKVSVDEQPCGATTFKNLGQPLSVSASGAWSLAATPTMRTVYRAKAKSATADVTVAVRPKVSLTKIGAHRFSVRIVAARSFAQRIALFQRRSPAGWRTVKSIPLLNVISGQTAPTMISGKDFRSGVAPGRRVRILLTQAQVGGCYAPGTSNTIRS